MKKLKEVSLLNDYRTAGLFIPAGQPLEYDLRLNEPWPWKLYTPLGKYFECYSEEQIINCETNLFKFTKELEEFKFNSFSDVTEKNYHIYLKNEINRLADYCDVHNNITETFSIAYDSEKDEFFAFPLYDNKYWTIQGLEFNSIDSAKLFIEILNKNHCSWREYLIKLLKAKRLN